MEGDLAALGLVVQVARLAVSGVAMLRLPELAGTAAMVAMDHSELAVAAEGLALALEPHPLAQSLLVMALAGRVAAQTTALCLRDLAPRVLLVCLASFSSNGKST